jgi:molybdate transport system ATP-binding protein
VTVTAELGLRLGALDLDVGLSVAPGEVHALLGPNGAGKTTVLRALAGLEPIERGRITIDEQLVDDPDAGIFRPPEDRPVGVVFQDHLLFPHLDVLDNVAFGPRARGGSRRAARAMARPWIERVGLTAHAGDRPSVLSGGQSQRAALARALATEPRLLLLDEPLAALDAGTRTTVRRDLRRHLGEFGGATILVTHDPLDALALADRVTILEHGHLTQTGTLAEVTSRPRTAYGAELLGVNLLRGRASAGIVAVDGGGRVTLGDVVDGPTLVLIRPRSISLHRHRPDTSARNQWPGHVTGFDLLGDHVRVRVAGEVDLVAEVTPAAVDELGLIEGAAVWASVKATDVTSYPA